MRRKDKNYKYNSFKDIDGQTEYEDAEYANYKETDSYEKDDDIEIEYLDSDDESDITDEYDEAFWEKEGNFITRLWRKRPFKVFLFIVELLVIFTLIGSIWLVCAENSKLKLITALSGCSLAQSFVEYLIGDEYNSTVLDTDFDEDDIETNDVELEGDYTNIAIFGVDSRNDDDASLNNNSDTIMILSINNETKEVKIASIYRDTLVQYTNSSGTTKYDKATNVYAYGGATMSISMLNTNFDLDISDYITINWTGLANIIDAFGGVDVTITDDEMYYINYYLEDLMDWTDLEADYLTESGDVHLDGTQAVAYCRIRYVTFYEEDGTAITDDYGRTARQRLVIQQLIDNAADCSVTELLEITQDLFEENTEENSFMVTSLSLSEILNLVPLMLEVEFDGGEGFPSSHTSYTTSSGGASLKPDTLLSTVIELHEYLFSDEEYTPSSEVKTLSEYLESLGSSASTTSSTTKSTEETTTEEKTTEETTTAETTTAETTTAETTTEETTTETTTQADTDTDTDADAEADNGAASNNNTAAE